MAGHGRRLSSPARRIFSPSTASAHLSRLVNSRLLICPAQGRHRYYRLAGGDVAGLLENMMTMAGKSAVPLTTRTPGTLRMARTCYDHLAGEVAVAIYDFSAAASVAHGKWHRAYRGRGGAFRPLRYYVR